MIYRFWCLLLQKGGYFFHLAQRFADSVRIPQ
nr:MAG TPA: hypothetical protein [Caudoviricetes sp.]